VDEARRLSKVWKDGLRQCEDFACWQSKRRCLVATISIFAGHAFSPLVWAGFHYEIMFEQIGLKRTPLVVDRSAITLVDVSGLLLRSLVSPAWRIMAPSDQMHLDLIWGRAASRLDQVLIK